jgi:hypothetical protein
VKDEEKKYKNIEEAKTAYFSYPEFFELKLFSKTFSEKLLALVCWCDFAKSLEEMADIQNRCLTYKVCEYLDGVASLEIYYEKWESTTLRVIEETETFEELSELLDSESCYEGKNKILRKMLRLASTKIEIDKVEEKNSDVRIDKLIPKRRAEISLTATEMGDVYSSLLKEDRPWALEKWMSLVKTVQEAKKIDDTIYQTFSLTMAREMTEKTEVIFMAAVNNATTIEELKEVSKGNYKASGKVADKKWDRLSLKEVEAATTDKELKIAKERSRDYSQAWHIATKKLKVNEPAKPFPWLNIEKLELKLNK